MTNNLPQPLTPADCDLRDFSFMPLDIVRLFNSDFHATATDAEWRAGVTLWGKSWHQVPAASLPDDDTALARLAEFGRDGRSWAKAKAKALHGWVKCNDGRLYHHTVAEKALEAWIEKLGQRKSSGAGNAKRWGGEFDPATLNASIQIAARMLADINPQSRTLQKRTANTANGSPEDIPSGSQGTGTGTLKKEVPLLRNGQASPADPENVEPPKVVSAPSPSKPSSDDKTWLFREGLAWLSKATGRPEDGLRSQVGKWRKAAKEDCGMVRAAMYAAQDEEIADPIPWITKAIEARVKAAAPFEPTDEHGWRRRFGDFKDHGAWPAKWGGSRPGDHPAHPREILAEFDLGRVT